MLLPDDVLADSCFEIEDGFAGIQWGSPLVN
jgi:hypothetical protein